MHRITTGMINNNLLMNLRRTNFEMNRVNNQIATQNRISIPHEDPNGTRLLMSMRSEIDQYQRYDRSIDSAMGKVDMAEGSIRSAIDLLQDIREKAVQGANGILTDEERNILGAEIEQGLRQVLMLANGKYKGDSLFGGHQTQTTPFEIDFATQGGRQVVANVNYVGDKGLQYHEVDRGEYVAANIPGNDVFWAGNHKIYAETQVDGYVAAKDSMVVIDGAEIQIMKGDNVQTIADKINNAGLSVKARIDNSTGISKFSLETLRPHQMWISDEGGSTIMQDLGILAPGGAQPPNNYAPSARMYGDNLFNTVINLRDSLLNNDVNGVNRGIGDIDLALNNLTDKVADIGSTQKRLEVTKERNSLFQVYSNEIYAQVKDVDMAEAITNLKTMEYSLKAALDIGSRILRPTLLDYMR